MFLLNLQRLQISIRPIYNMFMWLNNYIYLNIKSGTTFLFIGKCFKMMIYFRLACKSQMA